MSSPQAVCFTCQFLLALIVLSFDRFAQADQSDPSGQFDAQGVWSVRIELSESEFAAMEPAAAHYSGSIRCSLIQP